MRVIQLLPTLSYGDAVGNDTVAIDSFLRRQGYDTHIYAENVDGRMNIKLVSSYAKLPELTAEDVILYHFSTGSAVMERILKSTTARKIMIYHNITPEKYFAGYDKGLAELVRAGRESLKTLRGVFDCCLADSEYNKADLLELGYQCPIAVLPIVIPFADYEKKPNAALLKKYRGDRAKNWLFVGRVSPNKKQEDILRAFAFYHKNIEPESRLFLVGSWQGMERYSERLRRYAAVLGVAEAVVFTGHTMFADILAYYRVADVFVCMSEHEGFCVPLLEALWFGLPVVAFGAAAVPETLGGAGVVLDTREPAAVARVVDRVLTDGPLRAELVSRGKRRLEDFAAERTAKTLESYLKAILAGGKPEAAKDSGCRAEAVEVLLPEGREADALPALPEFSSIPVPELQRNVSAKERIRGVLRTMYHGVARLSPSTAVAIKEGLFAGWHGLKQLTGVGLPKLEALARTEAGILTDVTQLSKVDDKTGIQRVVNNIFEQMSGLEESVLAVRDQEGRLTTSYKYIDGREGLAGTRAEKQVAFRAGDKLLLLDSSWEYYQAFSRHLTAAEKQGVPSFVFVYDLFPVQYPELFESKAFVQIFVSWHDMILQQADAIICISRTTADVAADYFKQKKFARKKPLQVHFVHLGADISESTGAVRESLQEFAGGAENTFLMVGTMEPRKGHMTALEAFERLYDKGIRDRLLIIGKNGWRNDEIKDRIAALQKKGVGVLWLSDATDAELSWAYQHTAALIAASKDEGFGLPLVEAAYYGLPLICSDIPIFHEVAGEQAAYFRATDAAALAEAIVSWRSAAARPDSRQIRIYSWQETAQEVLDILSGKTEAYKVLR